MKAFTIRNIECQKIITCDDGDLILQHCKGDKLYLYLDHNGLPKGVEFNLRLSKSLVNTIKDKC